MKNMNIKFNNFITNVSLDRSRIIVDFKGDKFDDLKVKLSNRITDFAIYVLWNFSKLKYTKLFIIFVLTISTRLCRLVLITHALVRKVNVDRYDDREIIKTNLIESYNQLLEFGRKNLPDKFFLEGVVNKSLRNTIVREMVSNTLMHREFTSSYTAKFVIEKDRMYVENANRAAKEGVITVDNLDPNPKNPIIAAFFRNIGYADQLGSGVRKLFKYSKYYSGKDPQFVEDDVFRIIVPLDDSYSFDYGTGNGSSNGIETKSADKVPISADKMPINNLTAQQNTIFQFAKEKGKITSRQAEELLEVKQRRARSILGELVNMGILERKGMYKSTVYVLKDGKKNGNG